MTEPFIWNGEPLGVRDAYDHLNNFAAGYGRAATLLALHVAVLERFRGDLVALVRRNFLPKAFKSDVSADADVLFGPLSLNLGGGYFRMDTEVRRQCLVALDAWGSKQGDRMFRSRRVAQFVRRYVSWLRRHPPAARDPLFADYLNTIEWVALGFDDPDAAAGSLARHMKSRLSGQPGGSSAIRLTGLAAVLELPMAAFMDELNYARAMDALDDDDSERAVRLVTAHRKRRFRFGKEFLPPPQEMLDQYEVNRHLRRVGTKEIAAAVGDGDGASGPPSPDVSSVDGLSLRREPPTESELPRQDSRLHVAIKTGKSEAVGALLSASTESVDDEGLEGKTALHLAAERGLANLVELLLGVGANPDSRDARGETPLFLAAENGRDAVADLLVECANLEARNFEGTTPLAAAVANGHVEMARLLIEHGAAVDSPNDSGFTPLAFAASAGRLSIMELLLTHGADIRRTGEGNVDLMYLAARGGRLAMVEKMVDEGLPIGRRNENGWTPFLVAAFSGHAPIAEYLVELGAYLNDAQIEGWTALHVASYGGHVEVIRRLIRRGAAIDPELLVGGGTPLHIAAGHGHVQAAAELLAGGADPRRTASGMTPLHWACETGSGAVVRLLLSHPATDPTAADRRGLVPLQIAVEFKAEDAVRALLADPRTDCNVTNAAQQSPPLWRAADLQNWEAFRLLCEDSRTKVDWKDSSGDTQLHRSAQKNEADAVELLLAAGAQVDPVNEKAETPLHKAIAASGEAVVRSLLAHGADPERATGTPKHIPLATAVTFGSDVAVRQLVEAGARPDTLTPTGASLLHQAAALSKTEVVDALVLLGLRVDARDSEEIAPIHLAAAHSNAAMIRHLLGLGAKVDSRDRGGLTPLHYALRMGNVETVEQLIASGTDVTASTLDGWTAMHFAAQRHLDEAVGRLINAGASIEELSLHPPMTPLQAASESGATNVVKLLLAAGADVEVSNPSVGPPLVLAVCNGHYATAKALFEAGADLRSVDPVTGVGLLDLFHARQAKRELAGQRAEEAELEIVRIFREGVSISGGPGRQGVAEGADGQPTEPIGGESAEDGGESRPSAPKFAPLLGLDFDDPEAPVPEPWHVIRGLERLSFLEQIRQPNTKSEWSTESMQVLWTKLTFYDRLTLIRVRDRSWSHPRRCFFYLRERDNLFKLDGTSPVIHEVNVKAPVHVNESNVLDYARFFGFFVRGEGGPFYILEDPNGAALAPMSEDIRENVINGTIRPARLDGVNEEGHFLVEAVVAYSNALFLAKFVVHPTGMVEMSADEPLAADLPGQIIDAPIS